MLDLLSVTPELFIVLLLASFCAGCIDSVVGGGGMIQLPALLMAPGFSPVAALSTNKVASSMGTLTSASTYIRSLKIPWKILLPVAFVAFCASAAGAYCATILPAHIFRPAIVVVLAAILVFSVLQPRIPRGQPRALTTSSFLVRGFALGLILGGYDGILGAGTGAMMLVALQIAMGYDMLHATAAAKVLNTATNLGALLYFIPLGSIHWLLGIAMGMRQHGGKLGWCPHRNSPGRAIHSPRARYRYDPHAAADERADTRLGLALSPPPPTPEPIRAEI